MDDRYEAFTTQIAKISRCVRKIKTNEMTEAGLKSSHVSCLYFLYEKNGNLTARDLCELCAEDKATISRAIEFLEKKDYITCASSVGKRYKSPLFLTDLGKKVAQKIVEKTSNIFAFVGKGLSDSDKEWFYRCLAIISKNLETFCDKYWKFEVGIWKKDI